MESTSEYNWSWFRENMVKSLYKAEEQMPKTLGYYRKLDEVVCKLIETPTNPLKDVPQYLVAYDMSVRAFRLATSGIYLALSGYPDVAMGMKRAILEIVIRLLYMTSNAEEGAYGFLLDNAERDIAHLEEILKAREGPMVEIEKEIKLNIKWTRKLYSDIAAIAKKKGYDIERAKKKYGKVRMSEMSRQVNLMDIYKTSYAFESRYVHSRMFYDTDAMHVEGNLMAYEMGPIEKGNCSAVHDILMILMTAVDLACALAGKESAKAICEKLEGEMKRDYDALVKECG